MIWGVQDVSSGQRLQKTIGKWWFNGDLMGFNRIYPLVNVYKKLWKITIKIIGKSTISMAMF